MWLRSEGKCKIVRVLYVTIFVWYIVSLMMAVYTLAETCCSKTLQCARDVFDGHYPYFVVSSQWDVSLGSKRDKESVI
jgi:hypothetical protein